MDTNRRPTDPQWTQNQEVAFADGYPALIVTQVCKPAVRDILQGWNAAVQKPLAQFACRSSIVCLPSVGLPACTGFAQLCA